jgi:hypothetical protein
MSPLTTTVTFGPIDAFGAVTVKIIYDHRVLDGAYVARRLLDLEAALHGPVLNELLKREVTHTAETAIKRPHFWSWKPRSESGVSEFSDYGQSE